MKSSVAVGEWRGRAVDPVLLIPDEPTARVDIGSKTEIVEIIRDFADRGKGVLVISSEPLGLEFSQQLIARGVIIVLVVTVARSRR